MRAGAHMVKLEGGAWLAESTRLLSERGIPVCAHMGLTPQSINRLGGYRVQGRNPEQANEIIEEATILQEAGASILLLECVPVSLAEAITERLDIPVIGIGAGPHTDGQIMVMHDMLGLTPPAIRVPKFVKNFLPESKSGIRGAFEAYATAVKEGTFPCSRALFHLIRLPRRHEGHAASGNGTDNPKSESRAAGSDPRRSRADDGESSRRTHGACRRVSATLRFDRCQHLRQSAAIRAE